MQILRTQHLTLLPIHLPPSLAGHESSPTNASKAAIFFPMAQLSKGSLRYGAMINQYMGIAPSTKTAGIKAG